MLKDPQVWLQAAAQILFSLSLANGGLIAYASYNPTHSNTLKDTFLICFINCGTSIFAGIAMFSMIGHRYVTCFLFSIFIVVLLYVIHGTKVKWPYCL